MAASADHKSVSASDSGPLRCNTAEFGVTRDGERVDVFTLTNGRIRVQVITYGACIVSVACQSHPDAGDYDTELTLCHRNMPALQSRETNPYFGCTVGRYANRIAAGRFSVDGVDYTTPITFRGQSSHGGIRGWDAYVWRVAGSGVTDSQAFVTMTHTSPAGNEGFPGTVHATARYSLSLDNVVGMEFNAITDAPTPVNMANHAYWTMNAGRERVHDHKLALFADKVVDVDAVTQIPTGRMIDVATSPEFDFRHARRLGDTLASVRGGEQVGYDHSWVLDKACASAADLATADALAKQYAATRDDACGRPLLPAAELEDPTSRRRMVVFTTKPCMHVYTTNFLHGEPPLDQHYAVCLETQFSPDSPNQPLTGDCIVRPDRPYAHVTLHAFHLE